MFRLPAIRVRQRGVTLYLSAVPADILIKVTGVDVCEPLKGRPDGYQRPRDDTRCRQLAEYLLQPDSLLPNAVLANLRPDGPQYHFELLPAQESLGTLVLPNEDCVAWIVDGQHRVGAFEFVKDHQLRKLTVPVVFIEGFDRVREATTFFVVNSKQKNVSPSLKYFDLMRFADQELRNWLEGPASDWKVRATALTRQLNDEPDSPWYQRINLTGAKGTRRTINLVSFMTALQAVVQDRWFCSLPENRQAGLLKDFWKATELVWPVVWRSPRPRDFVLLKSLGVYAMCSVAIDVFHACRLVDDFSVQAMASLLEPLDSIVQGWTKDAPVAAYGGMKGYKLLAIELSGAIQHQSARVQESAGAADRE